MTYSSRADTSNQYKQQQYNYRARPVNPAMDVAVNAHMYTRISEELGGKDNMTPANVKTFMKGLLTDMGSKK